MSMAGSCGSPSKATDRDHCPIRLPEYEKVAEEQTNGRTDKVIYREALILNVANDTLRIARRKYDKLLIIEMPVVSTINFKNTLE